MNLHAKNLFDRFRMPSQWLMKKSECGANAEGGHGFQPGNTCASDDKSDAPESASKIRIKPRKIEDVDAKTRREWRETRAQIEDLIASEKEADRLVLAAKEKSLRKKMADAGHMAYFDANKADEKFENTVKFLSRFDKEWNKREKNDPMRVAEDAVDHAIETEQHGLHSEDKFPYTADKAHHKMMDVAAKHGLPISDYETIRSLYKSNNTSDFTVERFARILEGDTSALYGSETLEDLYKKKNRLESSDGGKWKIVMPSGEDSVYDDDVIIKQAERIVPKAITATFARLKWQPNLEPSHLAMVTYSNIGDEKALMWQAANGGSIDRLADNIADAVAMNAESDAPKMSEEKAQKYRDALKGYLAFLDEHHPKKLEGGEVSKYVSDQIDEINETIALDARIKHAASSIDSATKQPVSEVVRGLSNQFYDDISTGIQKTTEFKQWKDDAFNHFIVNAKHDETAAKGDHNIAEGKIEVTDKTAGKIKQHVVDNVVQHMKSTDEEVNIAAKKIWSHKSEMTHKDVVQEFVDTWAKSSSDHNQYALLLQEAVRQRFGDAFGMKKVYGGDFQLDWAREKLEDLAVAKVMEDVVDAFYDNTQKHLKEDSYLLFRGASWREKAMPEEVAAAFSGQHDANYYEWNNNDTTGPVRMLDRNIETNPISSFSSDYKTAHDFATGMGGSLGEITSVMAAYVPKNRIFGTFHTGMGCTNESEFVVLGGDPHAARMTLGGTPPYSRDGYLKKAKQAQEHVFTEENEGA